MSNRKLDRDGFVLLPKVFGETTVTRLLSALAEVLEDDALSVRARSSRGHVYAARNLIDSIPEISTVWLEPTLLGFLRRELGERFGLVRALFFDKPPDRTWSLPWHKDTSIAVKSNQVYGESFSRPTVKAGVPHLIACDDILQRMLTLRIHLDEVTDENGPLQIIPGSHVDSESQGVGLENAVKIRALAGDVLAMRPLISHASGSSIEGTRRHRRILHLEFSADAELPDGIQWYTFVPPRRH